MATPGRSKWPRATLVEAAVVARRYHLDGKQKSEIAEELGISRFKVARLLEDARDAGIVRISVELPSELDFDLGERLAERFRMRRVITVRSADSDPDALTVAIGRAAADYLGGILGPEDLLGIAWGRSLTAMADAFDVRSGADVVQLVGGVRAAEAAISGVELARRMAERTGGKPHALHAPLIVRTPEMARDLRSDPSLADATGRFDKLTVAAVGVGSWDPPQSALFNELSHSARSELRDAGAVADVCAVVLDAKGRPIQSPVVERAVGITFAELSRVPEVIALAGGQGKVDAILALLRSGVLSTLVTDASTAEELLQR